MFDRYQTDDIIRALNNAMETIISDHNIEKGSNGTVVFDFDRIKNNTVYPIHTIHDRLSVVERLTMAGRNMIDIAHKASYISLSLDSLNYKDQENYIHLLKMFENLILSSKSRINPENPQNVRGMMNYSGVFEESYALDFNRKISICFSLIMFETGEMHDYYGERMGRIGFNKNDSLNHIGFLHNINHDQYNKF